MNIRAILIERPIEFLKQQRILRDKFLRWFLIIALLLCMVQIGQLLIRLRPTGFVVPLEYVSGAGLTRLGDWRLIYGYGVYSLLVTLGNIALAVVAFEKSRITSFFLLLGAIVINIFAIVVTHTLLAQLG
ncbi:MAG: hypothetical protein WD467_01515 [Candidatus Saccharimonadales bacterium]